MTTQRKQALNVANDVKTFLKIDRVYPLMSMKEADSIGFELPGKHTIGIVMEWQSSDGEVTAVCPISRKALNISKKDDNIYKEIIKACIHIWMVRLKFEIGLDTVS